MADLPTGTVTFLFTDIEDEGAALWPRGGPGVLAQRVLRPASGTRRWEEQSEVMP